MVSSLSFDSDGKVSGVKTEGGLSGPLRQFREAIGNWQPEPSQPPLTKPSANPGEDLMVAAAKRYAGREQASSAIDSYNSTLDAFQRRRAQFGDSERAMSMMPRLQASFESLPLQLQRSLILTNLRQKLDTLPTPVMDLTDTPMQGRPNRTLRLLAGTAPENKATDDEWFRINGMIEALEDEPHTGPFEALQRFIIKPGGALLSGVQTDLLDPRAGGKLGQGIIGAFQQTRRESEEGGIDLEGRIDAFTDELDLRPGQQGFNELIAGMFLDPVLPIGPVGAAESAIFRGGARLAARSVDDVSRGVVGRLAARVDDVTRPTYGPLAAPGRLGEVGGGDPTALFPGRLKRALGITEELDEVIPADAPYIAPSDPAERLLGLRPIQTAPSRFDDIYNAGVRTLRRLKDDAGTLRNPHVQAAFRQRDRAQDVIDSHAARTGQVTRDALRHAFGEGLDESKGAWRVPRLAGVDPTVPGAPTISDIAARWPRYASHLSDEERRAMLDIRQEIDDFRRLLPNFDEMIIKGQRPDIVPGGWYIPRGATERLDEFDKPIRRATAGSRGAGKVSAERPITFDSQAAGIEAGWLYQPADEVAQIFVKSVGGRAADDYIARFFREAVDPETGVRLARTYMDRIDPVLARQVRVVRAKLHSRVQTLKRQVVREGAQAQAADDLDALSESIEREASRVESRLLDAFNAEDPLDLVMRSTERIRTLEKQVDQANRLANRIQRAVEKADVRTGRTEARVLATKRGIESLADELQGLLPRWKDSVRRATNEAGAGTRESRSFVRAEGIGTQLQGLDFPAEFSEALAAAIKSRQPISGVGAGAVNTAREVIQLNRIFRATGDNSAIGIQGLLAIAANRLVRRHPASNPVVQAMKVNLRAWADENVLGAFIRDFDRNARAAKGTLLDSTQWVSRGLHLGGVQTEYFGAGGLLKKLENAPVIREAGRAFGFFGDAVRLGWADDMLKQELGRGRTLAQIEAAGDLERIAKAANTMTGWVPGRTFGSYGDFLLFAPRFFQSRLETLGKGALGMRSAVGMNAPLDQRLARASLLKMVGYGTMLTVAINEALGNETDFRPVVGERYNSNFMRIRAFDRDWSLFGTWDSMLRMGVTVGYGIKHTSPVETLSAFRGASSVLVSNTWDFATGRTAIGEPVDSDLLTIGAHIGQNFVPFSATEVPQIGVLAAKGKVVDAAALFLGEFHGVKSAELSQTDYKEIVSQDLYNKHYSNLNDGQRKVVDADERVPPDDYIPDEGSLQQQVTSAFETVNRQKEHSAGIIADAVRAGAFGPKLREIVETELDSIRNVAFAEFDLNEDVDDYLSKRSAKGTNEDVWAGRYYDVQLQFTADGDALYSLFEAGRATVLADAKAAGVDPEYITGRGPGTYRGNRFKDELATQAVDWVDRQKDYLKPYWQIGSDPNYAGQLHTEDWVAWLNGSAAQRSWIEDRNPAIKRAKERRAHERDMLRRTDINVGKAGVYLYGWTPQYAWEQRPFQEINR